ncbi:DNA primase [Qipengyuania sp.]|uniref:DNA primase n=1 Tax=Qipengyuania sp. TaxID=2004515 RepID=UPI0035C83FB3
MILQSFLDEVEARTSMSGLVSARVKLTRNGREWKACCPVHQEKTPSFTVNDEKGFAHCFGCGFHAGPIRWLTEIEGLDFLDAVKTLAENAGLAMPARSTAEQAKAARVAGVRPALEAAQAVFAAQLGRVGSVQLYLQRRGVDQHLAETFGLGLAPDGGGYLDRAGISDADGLAAGLLWEREGRRGPRFTGRITVPVHDARGRIVGFSARVTPGGREDVAKYVNSPDSEIFDKGRLLFNLHRAAPAIRASKRALVVEGQFDVIALAGVGIAEAVAPMGTALTEAQLTRLWRLTRAPVLMFDGDAAGRKAARRACERALPGIAPDRTLKVALLPRGQDPDDVARAGGAAAIEAIVKEALALDAFLFGCVAEGIDADSSPEDRAAVWDALSEMAGRIAHEELRGEYLAAWRARYERLVSAKEPAGRDQALATTVPAEDGDYRWPESEDDSERRLIAVVQRLLHLRAEERAAMEPIREERRFARELAKMAGLRLPQIDAVVKMIEADMAEGSSAGRHESESVLVLYRRVLAIEGPLTEALLPVVIEARPTTKAVPAGAGAPPRAASALAWHDAGGM